MGAKKWGIVVVISYHDTQMPTLPMDPSLHSGIV